MKKLNLKNGALEREKKTLFFGMTLIDFAVGEKRRKDKDGKRKKQKRKTRSKKEVKVCISGYFF